VLVPFPVAADPTEAAAESSVSAVAEA